MTEVDRLSRLDRSPASAVPSNRRSLSPTVRMLGTRGVPAAHGGFETAVENIGRRLLARGWNVVVYCQDDSAGARRREEHWQGFHLIHLPSRFRGAKGTMWFDLQATRDAARHRDPCLTFGYNTAAFTALLKARGIPNIINMDGLEWKRARWNRQQRAFLFVNERAACWLADRLIGDHPEISRRLVHIARPEKVATIAYGAPAVTRASEEHLGRFGVAPGRYFILIARPVAENSILEVVRAFSAARRGVKLLLLGHYDRTDPYQRTVMEAAGSDVVFAGAVYDQSIVQSLRLHALAYVHGHTVGGTNPSLVEALGCGSPVIAHDNPFNRWVAGGAGLYFGNETDLAAILDRLVDEPKLVEGLARQARVEHHRFTWDQIADQYAELVAEMMPGALGRPLRRTEHGAGTAAIAAANVG